MTTTTFHDHVELARGSVLDRPWGLTLGGLALRGFTGDLVVTENDTRCVISLLDGIVVGASSSFAADSIARVALTSHLVSSTHVGEITKQLAAAPSRDELEVVANAAHLSPEQIHRLAVRLITQRAARTFSIDGGGYVVEDRVTLPKVPGSEVELRAVVYQGARMYLSEQRLADDLRALGTHFTIDPQAFAELHKFGFTDDERPILDALHLGASVAELEAQHRDIDPRTMQAVIYALASFKAVTVTGASRATTATNGVQIGRVTTQGGIPRAKTQPITGRATTRARVADDRVDPPAAGRTPTPRASMIDHVEMSAIARAPVAPRAVTARGVGQRAATAREPAPGRTPTQPGVARTASESGIALPRTVTSQDDRERAEQAFKRGESFVRADSFDLALPELVAACELSPRNPDYAALLAWVRFCLAPDKEAVAVETRRVLDKAIHTGAKPVAACFHLGRVERMLGRETEALRRFREVLDQQPTHADAASEVRVLEARLAANAKR